MQYSLRQLLSLTTIVAFGCGVLKVCGPMLLLAIAGALMIPVVALVLPSSGHDFPIAVPVCVILAYVLLRKRQYRTSGESSQGVDSSPK